MVTVGDRSAEIDLELVDLIEALWMLGIDTSFSCQGQFGPPHAPLPEPWGYIMFPDVEDLRAFLVCFDNTPLSSRRFAQRHEWNPEAETCTPVGPPSWELRGGVPNETPRCRICCCRWTIITSWCGLMNSRRAKGCGMKRRRRSHRRPTTPGRLEPLIRDLTTLRRHLSQQSK